MTPRKVIAGALSGFVAALAVDINAWSRSDAAFDWRLAVKRWIAGAITGAATAMGIAGADLS